MELLKYRKQKIKESVLKDVVMKRLEEDKYVPIKAMNSLAKSELVSTGLLQYWNSDGPCDLQEEEAFQTEFQDALTQKCLQLIEKGKLYKERSFVHDDTLLLDSFQRYVNEENEYITKYIQTFEILKQLAKSKIKNFDFCNDLLKVHKLEAEIYSQKVDICKVNVLLKLYSERKYVPQAHANLAEALRKVLSDSEKQLEELTTMKKKYESLEGNKDYKLMFERYLQLRKDISKWSEIHQFQSGSRI